MGYEVMLDNPGEIRWFKSDPEEEHRRPLGPCPHDTCPHNATSTVAWGPDLDHYELIVCDTDGPDCCDGWCRGWAATDDNTHGGTRGGRYGQTPAFMLMDRPSSLSLRERQREAV